jgi:NAD(P)-dependent dehydrogenase (short-subunit alcohol dehydrogenase family)
LSSEADSISAFAAKYTFMSGDHRLSNKCVLVTGAGTGIGRGIALECARAGATVAIHYSHSGAGAEEVVKAIQQSGGRAKAFGADFNEADAVVRLAKEVSDFLGNVDVLVNNSGITLNVPFDRITLEQFDILYRVNVRAGFFLIQKLLNDLIKTRGSVVNITSIHAFEGMREHTVYAGTKGAIVAYTRALAIELAPLGVRVNAIAPGCVPVANYEKAIGKYEVEEIGRNIPTGYVGTPQDIGKAVVFLASEDGRFIVGQTLVVDGGTTSWMPFGEQFRQPIADSGVQFGRGYVPGM